MNTPTHRLTMAIAITVFLLSACANGSATPAPTRLPTSAATAPATPTSHPTPAVAPTPTTLPATPTPLPDYPITLTDDEGTEVTLAAEPSRIVSLTPANTEIVFTLGAGDRLVGGTDSDDYPPEAADLPDVVQGITVLTEQVVHLEPDLVLAGGNNFNPPADIQRLRDLGIPVLVLYAQDLDGVNLDIELIGQAIGATPEAEAITAGIDGHVADVADAVAGLDQPRVFYEIGYLPEIYGPAPNSFIADMVEQAGGDAITTGDPAAYSISLEKLVDDDPEVIVLGDAAYTPPVCPDSVAARDGWDDLTAVVNGDIRPVNDLIVTRPGPRVGDGLVALALAIHPDAELEPPADSGAELCTV